MGSTRVEAPAPRNMAQEAGDTLATQIRLAPEQLAAYQQTAPGYAATDLRTLGQSLFGPSFDGTLTDINRRLTDEAAAQSRGANTAQRQADIADVSAMGGQVQAVQRGANGELFNNLDRLDTAAASGANAGAAQSEFTRRALQFDTPTLSFDTFTPERVATNFTPERVSSQMTTPNGPNAIESALQQQALDELALGKGLSADEARQVRVQSRAAADARGRGFSNAALADEVLNTAQAQQNRLDSRRAFATNANSTLRAGQAADRSYALAGDQFRAGVNQFNAGMGLSGAQLNSENARFNSGMGLSAAQLNSANRLAAANFNASREDAARSALGAAAGMESATRNEGFNRLLSATNARMGTYTDPFQGVLGRSSSNVGSNQALFGNAQGTNANGNSQAAGMFNPFNGYASDLYNTNYNAAAAANIATANNNASLWGSAIGGIGKLGAAGIGAGWFK